MPIELVWNNLKYFLCTVIQPHTLEELIYGVKIFWKKNVDLPYCNKKIDQIEKLIIKMIFLTGKATDFLLNLLNFFKYKVKWPNLVTKNFYSISRPIQGPRLRI